MIFGSTSIRKAYHPDLVVLAVEDHVLFSKEIKHALPKYTVVFARSVEEAKQCYNEYLPNITFLDIDLPDGNGFELLDHIRAAEPDAYIVILSGSKLQQDIDAARQKGAHSYILKPFTKEKIEGVVEEYLALREKNIKSLIAKTEQRRAQATANPSANT
jgi:two-component system chemotaxis response regulator CheY